MLLEKIRKEIENKKAWSAWDKGVKLYALEIIDRLETDELDVTEKNLLNGAPNWKEYSWGGSSLIYDYDIAKRLCAPWELKKTDGGFKRPNKTEDWLDVQARALYQAALLIKRIARNLGD